MNQDHKLAQWLRSGRPVLLDGAMGTMLHSRGFSFELCLDDLCRRQPEEVATIHRQYLEAGAQIIETNTFGANRFKLAKHGLENEVAAINQEAVALARRAVAQTAVEALVAGSVGPLGVRLAPFGRVRPHEAFQAYQMQIEALLAAGVDLLIVETQSDLHELTEAIRAARQLTSLPIVASMTFTRDDRTLLGDGAQRVTEKLVASGADVIGANCSEGPSQLLRLLEDMKPIAGDLPICLFPNAGWPERVADRILYPATPDYFADFARRAAAAGAPLIGGCCGTRPAHIRAMSGALRHLPDDLTPTRNLEIGSPHRVEDQPASEPTGLAQRVKAGQFTIAVEIDPPRGFSTHKALAGAHLLASAGADVINVADSPMARMRMSPWAVCQLIQRDVEIETVLHFPTRGRNLLRVQGDLLAAHALGVRNVFVVMGDPTAVGDYPEAMDNYDLVPTGLIRLVKHGFNSGVDHAGADIGGPTSFFVGCALDLGSRDRAREANLLHKKIEAGADFALTQPVFDPQVATSFFEFYRREYGPLDLPVMVGILPLYSEQHASFLHNEVPGIQIPPTVLNRLRTAGERAPEEGVRLAIELLRTMRGSVRGTYLMPPFGRYDLAAEIIEALPVPAGAR